jgi:hypothetical protein
MDPLFFIIIFSVTMIASRWILTSQVTFSPGTIIEIKKNDKGQNVICQNGCMLFVPGEGHPCWRAIP